MKKSLSIIILSLVFAFIPLALLWLHHQFVTGLNPFLAVMVTTAVLVISGLIYQLFVKRIIQVIRFTPELLFAIGSLSYLISPFLVSVFYGNSAFDINLHDTYYAFSGSNILIFIAIGFAIFAGIYYWCNKISGMHMNDTLGYIHFWISFLCAGLLLFPLQYEGLAGMPRRYYDYSDGGGFDLFYEQIKFISIPGFLLVLAQLLFVLNVYNTRFRKPK